MTPDAIEMKKHAYRQTQDGIVISFVVHPNDVSSALATATLGTRYMAALVEIGDDEQPVTREAGEANTSVRTTSGTEPKPNNADHRHWRDIKPSQQAGIRCSELKFARFLYDEHDASNSYSSMTFDDFEKTRSMEDWGSTYVRLITGVQSRSELDINSAAAAKWHDLDEKYLTWLVVA